MTRLEQLKQRIDDTGREIDLYGQQLARAAFYSRVSMQLLDLVRSTRDPQQVEALLVRCQRLRQRRLRETTRYNHHVDATAQRWQLMHRLRSH